MRSVSPMKPDMPCHREVFSIKIPDFKAFIVKAS